MIMIFLISMAVVILNLLLLLRQKEIIRQQEELIALKNKQVKILKEQLYETRIKTEYLHDISMQLTEKEDE